MIIRLEQDAYNRIEMDLSAIELVTLINMIGEHEIENITVKIKIPEADNG